MGTDPRIDRYLAAQADFARPVLAWLRARVHAACPTVVETIKWGMPFFTHQGRPLANMAAFKAHVSFGFWDRAAMATGHEGEAMGQYGRIESLADLPAAAALEAEIARAVAVIDSGASTGRAPRAPKPEASVPDALAQALADDALATAAWTAFPPGCRREYCDWVADAKRPDTRDRRVAQTIAQLREGKRINWKYEKG
ncbi:YdeI/OmpD-associated family protein [Sphingomonas sp.]|uniref:YdeI/OmpD-associated family protein n=1 Tax=Sphingomonas sp. TaxID=28214 RepID=UPI002BD378E5|nr:YdeI/OmpD-associated family protein [Sphingomonas sp.]HWK37267.1 YdeI/OmpD-associated family protein [Sphingomonas sp.]